MMTVKRIDHIAIVVRNLASALAVYRDALGLELKQELTVGEQGVNIAFLPSGDSQIELLEPISPDTVIGRYLAKRGEGLHHICLEVDDIEAAMAQMKAQGISLIDETPKRGAHGKIAFIHPKGTHGVLVELLQRDES
jgi:methylmalonyl-CoA/ethylmalonyl-CoA epimerase